MKKKLILGMTLLLALPLVGCNESNGLKKYSFKDELTDAERYSLLSNVVNAVDGILNINITQTTKTSSAMKSSEEKITYKTECFSNGKKETYKISTKSVNSKITIQEDVDRTITTYFEPGSKSEVYYAEDSKEGLAFYCYGLDEEKPEEEFAFSQHEALVGQIYGMLTQQNLKAYRTNKNGYAILSSSLTENHSYVTNIGKFVEKVTKAESQNVILVNKNFQITEAYMTSKTQTNQDPDTKEYLSSLKTTAEEEGSAKFKYGTRKNGDFSSITNEINKGYIEGLEVFVGTSTFELNEETKTYEVENSSDANQVAKTLKRVAPGKYHFEGTFRLKGDGGRIGFHVNLLGEAIPNLSAEVDDIADIEYQLNGKIDNTTSVLDENELNHYMMPEEYTHQPLVTISFDVAYSTNENNVVVDGIQVSYIPAMDY